MYSTGTHVCFLEPVNLPAPLPTVTAASPSLLHNLLCSVKSSSQTDQAWQHDNRRLLHIVWSTWAAISLYSPHKKKVGSHSPLQRRGSLQTPACTRGKLLGTSLLFISLTFLLHSAVRCASSQSAGLLSTLLSLQMGQHFWEGFEEGKRKKIAIWTILKSGTGHKQGSSDVITSKGLNYCWKKSTRKVYMS